MTCGLISKNYKVCSLGKNRPGFWKSGAIKIFWSAVSVSGDLFETVFYFPEFGFENANMYGEHSLFTVNFLGVIKLPE